MKRTAISYGVQSSRDFYSAPPHIRGDREVAHWACVVRPSNFRYTEKELRQDKAFVLSILAHPDFSDHLRRQPGMSTILLVYVGKPLWTDRDVVLAAVRCSGACLRMAPASLKIDREVVEAATHNCASAFRYADPSVFLDRDFILSLLSKKLRIVDHVGHFGADVDVMLAAVQIDGMGLRHAPSQLRENHKLVMAAVNQNGASLQYASPELRNNKKFVLAGLKKSFWALEHASPRLKDDKQVVLAAVSKSYRAMQFASERLCTDLDVVRAAQDRRPSGRLPYRSFRGLQAKASEKKTIAKAKAKSRRAAAKTKLAKKPSAKAKPNKANERRGIVLKRPAKRLRSS